MDEHTKTQPGMRILPGVDLVLWLRIVGFLIVMACALGGWIAAH